jgi:hypothetical protein
MYYIQIILIIHESKAKHASNARARGLLNALQTKRLFTLVQHFVHRYYCRQTIAIVSLSWLLHYAYNCISLESCWLSGYQAYCNHAMHYGDGLVDVDVNHFCAFLGQTTRAPQMICLRVHYKCMFMYEWMNTYVFVCMCKHLLNTKIFIQT